MNQPLYVFPIHRSPFLSISWIKGCLSLVSTLGALLFLSPILIVAQETSISPPSGAYAVGFEHFVSVDSTRRYQRKSDWTKRLGYREIPISIWYPAVGDPGVNAMTSLSYLEILKEEEEWEYLPNEQILDWFYYPNTPENQSKLKLTMKAKRGLRRIVGNHPLVVYAPGQERSSVENFALCEYLASHGYLVVSSPSRGTTSRFMESGNFRNIETQTRDLEHIIGLATTKFGLNGDEVYGIDHSFGGLATVYAQQRNPSIRGIISLDGAIKYQYDKIQASPYFDVANFTIPFAHFSQKDIPEAILRKEGLSPSINEEFIFFDQLTRSNALAVTFTRLSHSYFTSMGVLFQPRDPRQDFSRGEIEDSYALLCGFTKNLLDEFREGKEKLGAGIIAASGGAKQEIIRVDGRKESTKMEGYSFEDFHDLAAAKGYEGLEKLYRSYTREHAGFSIEEWKLNNLGLQLMYRPGSYDAAIKVFRLAVRLYPQSANLYDSMGEAYLFGGEREKARESFLRSLELNKQNSNAASRLEELKE